MSITIAELPTREQIAAAARGTMSHPVNTVKLTAEGERRMDEARIGFMSQCPFYAHLYYTICQEVFTTDLPTAATDGKRIYINPAYMASLKPMERVFVLAHEVDHVVNGDAQRMKNYGSANKLRHLPWDSDHFNIVADYRVNAGLVEIGVGAINPDWLYSRDVQGSALVEDVYVSKWRHRPPPPQGGGQGQGQPQPGATGSKPGAAGAGQSQGQGQSPETWGASGRGARGAKGDPRAKGDGGRFDTLLPPRINPVTGKEDVPQGRELVDAIAEAAAVAKAQGKLPAGLQRLVDAALEPQIDWREHLRMHLVGKIGHNRTSWKRAKRRRLALNPLVFMPGRTGTGCDLVVMVRDTSGSMGPAEYGILNGEMHGILSDCHPRKIIVLDVDAAVHQVSEVRSLYDAEEFRTTRAKGGGGTSFIPAFDWVAAQQLRPELLIYITDMMGSFPSEAPTYPTMWVNTHTKGAVAPFGEVVDVDLKEDR
jgi:predicted metal-dependent peptidase